MPKGIFFKRFGPFDFHSAGAEAPGKRYSVPFSANGGPEGPGHAAESRFLYQFLAVKCAVPTYRVETAILQEIDVTHRKAALVDFRWQSIDFVDALKCRGTCAPGYFFRAYRRFRRSLRYFPNSPQFSRVCPQPRATHSCGYSARRQSIFMPMEMASVRPESSAPPPVKTMPVS